MATRCAADPVVVRGANFCPVEGAAKVVHAMMPHPDADGMEIAEYAVEPGDPVASHYRIWHGPRGKGATQRRRAFSLRLGWAMMTRSLWRRFRRPTSPPLPRLQLGLVPWASAYAKTGFRWWFHGADVVDRIAKGYDLNAGRWWIGCPYSSRLWFMLQGKLWPPFIRLFSCFWPSRVFGMTEVYQPPLQVLSGLAVYWSQWPTGLVRFQKTDVESGLILAIAVACVGLYLQRYAKDERVLEQQDLRLWRMPHLLQQYGFTASWHLAFCCFGVLSLHTSGNYSNRASNSSNVNVCGTKPCVFWLVVRIGCHAQRITQLSRDLVLVIDVPNPTTRCADVAVDPGLKITCDIIGRGDFVVVVFRKAAVAVVGCDEASGGCIEVTKVFAAA